MSEKTVTTRRTVTIVLPEGYKDANEFCDDCGFELVAPLPDITFEEAMTYKIAQELA